MSKTTAPNSRPVHPCYLSVWEGNAGSEYSTWANVTDNANPNLVIAQASTLIVYELEESTGKLVWVQDFFPLAGNVCYLESLPGGEDHRDSLLIGFSGIPRLAIVSLKLNSPKLLWATALLDLGPALTQHAYGAVTPLEQDLSASIELHSKSNSATLAIVLGGGVAVACLSLKQHSEGGWGATSDHPYILPLSRLSSTSFESKNDTKEWNAQSIVSGFGDIISIAFLPGYLEPTLVVLHSHPHVGRTCSFRLGRQEGGTRYSLLVTAVTVTVEHERAAVLWSTEVPADAEHVYRGAQGCLVQCVNSLVSIDNTGQVEQCLAVNGWVESNLSLKMQPIVEPNPWPFPKLAISLDGAQITFVKDTAAFVVLRCGQIYLLQYTTLWSLLPLYNTVGALGQVSNLKFWPLGNVPLLNSKLWDENKRPQTTNMEMGLLFVGSRLGDSSLLGYALEQSSVADAIKEEPGLKIKRDENGLIKEESEDYDRILQLEEDALYAPTEEQGEEIDVVPPSDDEEVVASTESKRKRARLSQLTVVRSLTVLDSITALGPLGPACSGPLAESPENSALDTITDAKTFGSTGYIFPCGYGSSGGLALLTAPGRDDRTILAEEDCINGIALFDLPKRGVVVLSTADKGTRFMRFADNVLAEIDLEDWSQGESLDLLTQSQLLAVCELSDESFALLVATSVGEKSIRYTIVFLNDSTGTLSIQQTSSISVPEGVFIQTVTPFTERDPNHFTFACTLSSGDAKVISIDADGELEISILEAQIPMDMEDKTEEEQYYATGKITAVDIFRAPTSFFSGETGNGVEINKESSKLIGTIDGPDYLLDEDDKELYGEQSLPAESKIESTPKDTELPDGEDMLYFALCRQSGMLEIYTLASLTPGQEVKPIWSSSGCGHGVPQLESCKHEGSAYRPPRMHKVHTREMRFFVCGPATSRWERTYSGPRPFCFAVETTSGDTLLYSAKIDSKSKSLQSFDRIPLKTVTRPSQEQSKHFSKLRRKGIVGSKDSPDEANEFNYNRLFRFNNVSGQDGLFAAVARPIWFIAERGKPSFLCHRSRHAAPAGARPRPVSGFCSNLQVSEMTGWKVDDRLYVLTSSLSNNVLYL